MGNSYPDKTNASGIWKINEISKNKVTNKNFPNGGARGLWMGGGAPGISDVMDFITFSTTVDATDFGNLSAARDLLGGGSSATRALSAGGQAPGVSNVIDFVTIAATGNASDFGDLTDQRGYCAGMANDTRQITSGGLDPGFSNIIDFVEMASTGNAVDFGNLTSTPALNTNCASPTRGINCGGTAVSGGGTNLNIIDFIEISSTGNALDFGDLTGTQRSQSSFGSNTRMVTAGGQGPGTTKMEAIQFASLGNAVDFADSLSGTTENGRGTSDNKRGVFAKGAVQNVLETKNIFNGAAAVDFGDLSVARTAAHAASNGHGGLKLTS